jgi:Tol biopolymer transport system component
MNCEDPSIGTTARSPRRGLVTLACAVTMCAVLLFVAACDGSAGGQGGGGPATPSPSPSATAASPWPSVVPLPSVAPDVVVDLFPVAVNGSYGFIDPSGAMVIEPRFRDTYGFSDGLAAVKVGDLWGFVDPSGKLVIRPRYAAVSGFSGGLAAVSRNYRKYGYIDKTGTMVIKPRFFEAGSFSQGLAWVSRDLEEYGFIDTSGTVVIEPQYESAGDFSEGLAGVMTYDGLVFIDASGTVAIRPSSTWGEVWGGFSEGLVAVKTHGKWGYADTSGEVVIGSQFKAAGSFSDGLAPVQGLVRGPAHGRWGFVDSDGTMTIEPRFGEAAEFSEGLAAVAVKGRWGYIDESGAWVVEPQFSTAGEFSGGLAAVELYGDTLYIDEKGDQVWPAPTAAVDLPAAVAASHIAFVRNDDIWTIHADGSAARQLTHGSTTDALPTWAPDGETVAFVRSAEPGETPSIDLVPAQGGKVRTLLRDTIPGADYSWVGGLAFSPDGRRLAYADSYGSVSSNVQHCRIAIIDLATGGTQVLLEHENGFGTIDASWGLSWSPDGTTLLVSQGGMDAEGGETWLFRLADGGLSKLPIADASHAEWSPDGASIVVSPYTQTRTRILVARPDGQVVRTLAKGGGWEGAPSVSGACFSDDGSWAAYTLGGRAGAGIWIMKADGSGRRGLTDGSQPAWR